MTYSTSLLGNSPELAHRRVRLLTRYGSHPTDAVRGDPESVCAYPVGFRTALVTAETLVRR